MLTNVPVFAIISNILNIQTEVYTKMKKSLIYVIKDTLPVMADYMVLSFGFGLISEKAGYGVVFALAMSIFIYAGSMKYVTGGLLTGGASLITAALTTLMVNARHLFYGISMVEAYKNAEKKPYLIFGLTDETYSLVCEGKTPDKMEFHKYCFLITLFNHIYWIVGTILGVFVGNITNFNTDGVEFAMTALFVTVLVEQWKTNKNHISAIIGLSSSVICLLIFGKDSFLIPSMLLIGILLLFERKNIQNTIPC